MIMFVMNPTIAPRTIQAMMPMMAFPLLDAASGRGTIALAFQIRLADTR
jgi:hypothetical protein